MSIISPENKAQLVENLKSFSRKFAFYALIGGSAFALANLHLLTIPAYLLIPIGFGLGEIHSWAQNQYDLLGNATAIVARAFKR